MSKIFKKIHLWLSVPVGVFVVIICITGALMVFEKDITEMLSPSLYKVENVGDRRLNPSELLEKVNAQTDENLTVTSLEYSGQPDGTARVSYREKGKEQLFVDPYTGQVKGWGSTPVFFATVKKLHRWLMDAPSSKEGGSVGRYWIGTVAVVMSVILITGLLIWIPLNRKMLSMRLKVVANKGLRRFLYDSHVALGFYALLFLLMMSLTGPTWSFPWYRTAFYSVFGVSQSAAPASAVTSGKQQNAVDFRVWDKALESVSALYPDKSGVVVENGKVKVTVSELITRRQDVVEFDGDGNVLAVKKYAEQPKSSKIKAWILAFHSGQWGGVWVKFLYFFAALIGASLPITGYYMWLKRKLALQKKPSVR